LSENEKAKTSEGDVYVKEFYDTIGKMTEASGPPFCVLASGLPDGLFSGQKSHFCFIFVGLGDENLG
jgi:hypothetical protein